MKQSPFWESNSHSAGQEIHLFLWDLKVYYRVHKSQPLNPYTEPDASSSHSCTLLFKINFVITIIILLL
jgi:hypothetical protein